MQETTSETIEIILDRRVRHGAQAQVITFVALLLFGIACEVMPLYAVTQQTQASSIPVAGQQATNSPTRPVYNLDRSEEDWSLLRDTSLRTDFWDPIKYIPLGREDWYLSLGGEFRTFYEFYRNYNWGAGPQDDDGFFLNRFIGHADAHFGKRVHLFFELKSGLEFDRAGGPRPPDEDKLDLSQLFLELHSVFREGQPALTIRLGRQELNYGEGTLVAIRELNVRREFDGAKLVLRPNRFRIDAFVVKPAQTKAGLFDDAPDPAQTFWGIYAVTTELPPFLTRLDFYYLGLDRDQARFDQGVAHEQRHTVGVSAHGQRSTFSYYFEGDLQFGRFGSGQLIAWKYAQILSYAFPNVELRPVVSLLGAISSGDRDPANPDLQTFHPLFPKGLYYSFIDGSGSLNAIVVHPKVGVQITKSILLAMDGYFFWRQRATDGLYSQPGFLLRGSGATRARYVGSLQDLEILWHFDQHATVQILAAYYEIGPYLRETPPQGMNTTYFSIKMNYKF